jgi:DNA-directed RNA polymerase subunit M/transcription elongation factor TFIIS
MAPIISNPCPCGRQIKATDPEPGQEMRCYYCGHVMIHEGDGAAAGEPFRVDEAGGPVPATLRELGSLLDRLKPMDLTCPDCGAPMVVAFIDTGDKVATCEHCGHEADLPERRGVTRKRVSRRPGRTDIIEESAWTEEVHRVLPVSEVPVDGGDGEEFPAPETEETELEIELDGDPDDPEVFARFLRQVKENLPPDQVDAVITEMKRVMRRRS